ncbi:hypothetical protein I79_022165 [Cricetulus griseus]|uniref:Uncharacterized protein n=1 Tax=Cricetulus griseus TaxID=10029 RepID=G3IEL6_CRIGR|nr:hypothetical protein I79_022165 [Cricetulus griseus]
MRPSLNPILSFFFFFFFESAGHLAGHCLFHAALTTVLLTEFVCLRLTQSHCESWISKLSNKPVFLKRVDTSHLYNKDVSLYLNVTID